MQSKKSTPLIHTLSRFAWLGILALLLGLSGPRLYAGKGGNHGGGGSEPPTFGEPEIAFTNGSSLMLLDANGNMKELFSAGREILAEPTWSPDGNWIAFVSTLDSTWGLYVIGVDGQGLTRISDVGGSLSDPAWSPNGGWIAFSDNFGNDRDVFVVDVDCANQGWSNCLFHFETPDFRDYAPVWSPSGDQLAVKVLDYSTATREIVTYQFGVADGTPFLDSPQLLTAATDPVLSVLEGEGNLIYQRWSNETDRWISVSRHGLDGVQHLSLIDTWNLGTSNAQTAFDLRSCPECDASFQPSWSPCNSELVVATLDPNNAKNGNRHTLAFLELGYDPTTGAPSLQSTTYLPRASSRDSYNYPAWRPGSCTQ